MLGYIYKIKLKIFFLAIFICTAFYCLLQFRLLSMVVKPPVIIWWTPFMFEMEKIINCDGYTCILTKNRHYKAPNQTDVYLFYGSNIELSDLPLPRNNAIWAIFHEESPKNLPFFLDEKGQQLFNITSTFSRFSNFPIPLQYLKNIDNLSSKKFYVPLTIKNQLLNLHAPILYLQSDCDTPIQRDKYVSEIMKHIKVDSYGACLNNKRLPKRITKERVLEDLYDPILMEFIARYKFVIAIENAICDDYITEKLWRPLMVGAIPIYLGSPTVADWLPNENSAIIINDFNNLTMLINHIKNVHNNNTLYNSYLSHKTAGRIGNKRLQQQLNLGDYGVENNKDDLIPAFECFVCKGVHLNAIKNIDKNVYNCSMPTSKYFEQTSGWEKHWQVGKCQAKTLSDFVKDSLVNKFSAELLETLLSSNMKSDKC